MVATDARSRLRNRLWGHNGRASLRVMDAPRTALGMIATVILCLSPMVSIGPAAADSPGCVTAGEFRDVRDGMTRAKVQRIFDTKGMSLFENPGAVHNSAREYPMCAAWKRASGDSKVQVQYNNYATNGGPQRVVHRQHY